MTSVMIVIAKSMSELLGLEHGDAQVQEHHDGQRQEEPLGPGHTRSSAQMSPSIATTKPTMPSTARKSAMGPGWPCRCEPDVNTAMSHVNKMSMPAGCQLCLR